MRDSKNNSRYRLEAVLQSVFGLYAHTLKDKQTRRVISVSIAWIPPLNASLSHITPQDYTKLPQNVPLSIFSNTLNTSIPM